MMGLTARERTRYSRHLLLPELGEAGQERLRASSVLLVGAGGLGSPAALYLAAAGVGTLGIVDDDVVDETNLQRQVLYGQAALGRSKTAEAKARLEDLNPLIRVVEHGVRLSAENAMDILGRYDLVVDGSDNFPTRYLVNDAAFFADMPVVFGSIQRFEGQVSVFHHDEAPCYRCLYAAPPPPGTVPNCDEAGVLGILPGVVGTLQATEAIKLLLGQGRSLAGRLLLYDALAMTFDEVEVARDSACALCGDVPSQTELIDYEAWCRTGAGVGRGTEQGPATEQGEVPSIGAGDLRDLLRAAAPPVLLDVREPGERIICQIEDSVSIPLRELANRLDEVPGDVEVVAYCKSGVRSAEAVRILGAAGWQASNLRGGILAWIDEVEPDLARY